MALPHGRWRGTLEYLKEKFASDSNLRDANIAAFKPAAHGETKESFAHRYEVGRPVPEGTTGRSVETVPSRTG